MDRQRRQFLGRLGAAGVFIAAGLPLLKSCSRGNGGRRSRVVVIGGGYGGATCARYLRQIDPRIGVTLVEPKQHYVSCPFSNAVLGGLQPFDHLVQRYVRLRAQGVEIVHDRAVSLHPDRQEIKLKGGDSLAYDRVVISPGISMRWNYIPEGYDAAAARVLPHAWSGGDQLKLLHRQLTAMKDGGLFVISVPGAPFRCPPGPYERASLAAHYLKTQKPRSKILILDANEKFAKQDLFEEAWEALYGDMIERIPISRGGIVERVDVSTRTLFAEAGRFQPDVANIIPFQSAGTFALENNLADDTGWCPVEHDTFESTRVKNVHVLGDSCLAGAMPKSASSANSQAKACSLAIAALVKGEKPPAPSYHNTCYSLASPDYGFSISDMYVYKGGGIKTVERAGGLSPLRASPEYRRKEAEYAQGWFDNINADTFG